MTDTDAKRVILQDVEDGLVRCLHRTWSDQRVAVKSMNRDECLYYYDELVHCWLPAYTKGEK